MKARSPWSLISKPSSSSDSVERKPSPGIISSIFNIINVDNTDAIIWFVDNDWLSMISLAISSVDDEDDWLLTSWAIWFVDDEDDW